MYLLRAGASGDEDDLRKKQGVRELPVHSHGDSISAFLVQGDPRAPGWVDELTKIADVASLGEESESRSYGAVVFVTRGDRVLAVCFGTGFHAIEPARIERGFGLRVTANIVQAGKIRGAQTRGIASNSRDQKTLLPVDGSFSDLAVEVDEDWLRQLSGKSSDGSFGTTLAGSDSLRITIPQFSLESLPAKADQVLATYQRDDYKKQFPFLDQITPLDKSDERIAELDELVVDQIRTRDATIAFAAPDPFEQGDLDHYELGVGYAGRFTLEELTPGAVFDALSLLDEKRSPLEDVKVRAFDEDGALVDRVQSLRAYVQAEVVFDGANYLLSAGLWFEVLPDFSTRIQAQIDRIPDLTEELSLPVWDSKVLADDTRDKTAEGSYNIAVAESEGYALLDKKLVVFSVYERLEISDLLTPEGHLLCVKSASSSATLSHLVAQAVNSANAWGDSRYKERLATAWDELHGEGAAELDRSDATFVLAIATPKPGPLSESLFFFTKVQIANCLKLLERAGFKIALARIDMEPVEPKKVKRKSKVSFSESDVEAGDDEA
ncbi:DUF6119 family protein [Microbacterium sp. NPDC097977]|uniref:DUF6119 family protein n=1 Tax=Microbacterium sp. NPDC097977 TaxID=3155686 RepID=UPI003316CBB9